MHRSAKVFTIISNYMKLINYAAIAYTLQSNVTNDCTNQETCSGTWEVSNGY